MHFFVVIIEYKTALDNIVRTTDAHREHLKAGYESGILLVSGPQVPRTGGIVIARCAERSELEEFFSKDPYYLNSYADYRYIEFDPKSFQPFLKDWAGK